MISEVELGIIALLQERWSLVSDAATIAEFDIAQDFEDLISYPAISLATETIPMDTVADAVTKCKQRISVYQVFKNVGGGKGRRHGVYPIVEGTVRLLAGKTLLLDIDPLRPLGSAEVYHETLKKLGAVCFKTQFETVFTIDPMDDSEEAVRLLSEGLNYYDGKTSVAMAADSIEYEENQ